MNRMAAEQKPNQEGCLSASRILFILFILSNLGSAQP